MSELVICKTCNFVMRKDRLKDKCPACAVPARMFIPYEENLSPKRKFLLLLDIHPVLVHFTQAFVGTLPILALLALFIGAELRQKVVGTIFILAWALPLSIILAFLGGIVDGRIRFRRVSAPLLRQKIILSVLFLLFSCAILVAVLRLPEGSPAALYSVIGLSLPALACSTLLGLIGVSLLNAKFPG